MTERGWENVVAALSDRGRYPYIPTALAQHAKLAFKSNRDKRWPWVLLGDDMEEILTGINTIFQQAVEATGFTPDELLRATEINVKDSGQFRIDGAFAEIRAMNFLYTEGFIAIRPIISKNTKEADIVAAYNGERFAIEVTHSAAGSPKKSLEEWIFNKLVKDKKLGQLEQTRIQYSCSKLALISIINNESILAVKVRSDFMKIAETVWNNLGRRPDLHIAIVTGREAFGYGPDDVVFPEWPR